MVVDHSPHSSLSCRNALNLRMQLTIRSATADDNAGLVFENSDATKQWALQPRSRNGNSVGFDSLVFTAGNGSLSKQVTFAASPTGSVVIAKEVRLPTLTDCFGTPRRCIGSRGCPSLPWRSMCFHVHLLASCALLHADCSVCPDVTHTSLPQNTVRERMVRVS